MAGPEEALRDEQAVCITAQILREVTSDPDNEIAQQLASGELSEEQLRLFAALVVTQEIGRTYVGEGTVFIGDMAAKLNEHRDH